MDKCRVLMITSCKGGVGKTTVCANLGMALAKTGKRVLMIDCDFGMRCLDLVCGLEDRCMYDLSDVIVRHIAFDKAIICDERSENLFFLAAPYEYKGDIDKGSFVEFIKSVKQALELDYILMDTHGGVGEEIGLGCEVCDMALIIATHQSASIRAAEQTNIRLRELGVENTRLILNNYDQGRVKKGVLPSVIDIIDKTCVRLIGLIPTDPSLIIAQSYGRLIDSFGKTDTVIAFSNIALRIMGYQLPLMQDMKNADRKVILK